MPKKPKHPREMTTEEAVKHLFHPEVLKHLKRVAHGQPKLKGKKK
jgi:hypothetical protein